MRGFPRLMVVTSFAPDGIHGGPYVMRQLLHGYPKDRLAWWCAERPPAVPEFVPCQQLHGCPIPARLVAHKRCRALKNSLAERLWVPWAARDLRLCLDRWAPDDVVFLAHDWTLPVFVRAWGDSPSRRLHLIVHDFMDHADYAASRGHRRAGRFMCDTERLYAMADSRTVISTEMAHELRRATGREADLIAPCGVEPEAVRHIRSRDRPFPLPEVRIAYTGTVTAPETMGRFVAALARARNASPCPIWLDFLGSSDARQNAWFQPEWMTYGGVVSDVELAQKLSLASFGLCVMNDDLSNPRYDKYSFPCKFTAYLAAGLPILAVGHPDGSLIGMMKRFPVGLTLEGNARRTWPDKLASFLAQPDRGAGSVQAMAQAAESLFNADRNRRAFQALITR